MTKLQNDIVMFAQANSLDINMYDRAKDLYRNKKSIDGNTKVSFDASIPFDVKEAKLEAEMRTAVSKMSGVSFDEISKNPAAFATNPMVNWATFAVVGSVIDAILPDALIDSVGIYSDIRIVGYGDSASFEIKPRDLFTVSVAGRGKRQAELHRQYSGTQTIVPVNHEVSVYVSLYRVLAGIDSLADFMMKVAKSIEYEMNYEIYDAFATAMNGLPTTPANTSLSVAGYSQAAFVALAQKVTAWNQGNKAVAIGTQTALATVLPSNANYRYMLDSDYAKIGYVPNIFGVDLIVLPQMADYTNPFALKLDDTKIYMVSPSTDKPIKVVLGGDTLAYTSGTYDHANLMQTGSLQKQWGISAITNSVAGQITLS